MLNFFCRRAAGGSLLPLLLFTCIGCASIQPPPGGPEDKTPPAILLSTPADRATNVSRSTELHFQFADAVDRTSFVQSITISPYVNGKIKYHWSGYDEVTVELPEQLREHTTYSITLGRDLKSRHSITLPAPLHLTFSTGSIIDTASLTGFVLPAIGSTDPLKASAIFVFAYDLSRLRVDTLNYATTPPDLITQPDDKGAFEFLSMVQSAKYRVIAVQDEYRNHVYDRGTDNYGMPTHDAQIDSVVNRDFRIRMSLPADTTHAELQDVVPVDRYHIRAIFSKAPDSLSIARDSFLLRSIPEHASIAIAAAVRLRQEKHPGEITLVTNTPLTAERDYELVWPAVAVKPANDTSGRVRFTNISTVDTFAAPRPASISIADSAHDISVMPIIDIHFTDAVVHAIVDSAIVVTDTLHHSVPFKHEWLDDAHLVLTATDTLHPREFYSFHVPTASLVSPVANRNGARHDTTYNVRFETEDYRNDGELSGTIRVSDSMWAARADARIVVELLRTNGEVFRTATLGPTIRHYDFSRVPKGTYRVRAYFISGMSQHFDSGSIVPFRFAAPSGDFGSELDIRARWATDRVDFELK